MAGQAPGVNTDQFDLYFRKADLDGDGRISGAEAVSFFQGSNLPKHVLAQVCITFQISNYEYVYMVYQKLLMRNERIMKLDLQKILIRSVLDLVEF